MFAAIIRRLDDIRDRVTTLEDQVETIEDQVATIEDQVATIEEQIFNLNERVTRIKNFLGLFPARRSFSNHSNYNPSQTLQNHGNFSFNFPY